MKSLDFLSKFIRENPNIEDIDIGENPLSDVELKKFTEDVRQNPIIRSVGLQGIKNLKSSTKTQIQREVEKNA